MVHVPIGVTAAVLSVLVPECLCQASPAPTSQCTEDGRTGDDDASLLQAVHDSSPRAHSTIASERAGSAVSMWADFKATFGKTYSGGDDGYRFKVFKTNLALIDAENAKNLSYKIGVTPFADLTVDEFASAYLAYKKPEERWDGLLSLGQHTYQGEALADSVDWTKKGMVTPVKDQGTCGAGWAFSAVGALESAWAIASAWLVSLSEQQFVDCSKQNFGCNGGSMTSAFKDAKGLRLCTESSYPYMARERTCESSCTTAIRKGAVTGYKHVGLFGFLPSKEQDLVSALQHNPVSVAVAADGSEFQLYMGGILSCFGRRGHHGVLAVGYDAEAWHVKNSFGTAWGEKGYARISRHANSDCGILSDVSYPVM